MLLGEALDAGRQPEVGETRHPPRDHAERERGGAALAERVDAEAGEVGAGVGDVELPGLLEGLVALRRDGGQRAQAAVEVLLGQLGPVERGDGAVEADQRRPAELEVDVGGPGVDRGSKQGVEIHPTSVFGNREEAL